MNKVYELISTGFYIGYFPAAPGTFGSLTAVFIVALVQQITNSQQIAFLQPVGGFSQVFAFTAAISTFFVGLFCVDRFLKDTKEKDPGYVVIDEWAGQFTTYSFVPLTHETFPLILIAGFVLFRIFDISKIYPINKMEKLKGALGIMVDDMAAGVFAGICLYVFHLFL